MMTMTKPIISRHGSKGGRFIDGMYTYKDSLPYIKGIIIVEETGIYSDHNMVHNMVVSKFDLGLQQLR
jgi:hypothetical protein